HSGDVDQPGLRAERHRRPLRAAGSTRPGDGRGPAWLRDNPVLVHEGDWLRQRLAARGVQLVPETALVRLADSEAGRGREQDRRRRGVVVPVVVALELIAPDLRA